MSFRVHERATPPTQGRSNFESQKKSVFRVHETPLFFGRQIWAGVPVLGIAILRGVLAMFSRKLPFRVHGRPTSGGPVVGSACWSPVWPCWPSVIGRRLVWSSDRLVVSRQGGRRATGSEKQAFSLRKLYFPKKSVVSRARESNSADPGPLQF